MLQNHYSALLSMSIFQRSGASEKQQQQELPELKSESKGWKVYLNNAPLGHVGELLLALAELAIDINVTTLVNVTGAPVTNTVANHDEKLEKFNGQNFKRWQQKMFFYLTTLNLALFLKETAPQVEPPREESLERMYKIEDAATKKFVVAYFLDYKMVDSKNMMTQVQDLHVLLHEIHAEGMTLSETFQVVAIIEKLPPS
ncbi:hypothetical protein Tco_1427181 [Tanacetum coccineum]